MEFLMTITLLSSFQKLGFMLHFRAEEEFDALQIQPPQATSKKDSKSHRKEEKRKHSRHSNRDRERRHKRK